MKFIYLAIFMLIAACSAKHKHEQQISVSIPPLKFFTERIAGDILNVNTILADGSDPHSFDMGTKQMIALDESEVCISMGVMPFETEALRNITKERNIDLIELVDSVNTHSQRCNHQHHTNCNKSVDPHFWSSPENALRIVEAIKNVLINKYPENKNIFLVNAKKIETEIKQLQNKMRIMLTKKTKKSFLIYHPSLGYLAEEFNLNQISIENNGKEPSPKHIKYIVDLSNKEGIKLILIQSQFDKSNAEIIAKEINGNIKSINPLAYDWIKEMNNMFVIFKEYLI